MKDGSHNFLNNIFKNRQYKNSENILLNNKEKEVCRCCGFTAITFANQYSDDYDIEDLVLLSINAAKRTIEAQCGREIVSINILYCPECGKPLDKNVHGTLHIDWGYNA